MTAVELASYRLQVEHKTYYLTYGAHFTVEHKTYMNVYGRWNYSDGDVEHGSMDYGRFFEEAIGVLAEPVVLYANIQPVPWAKRKTDTAQHTSPLAADKTE